MKNPKRSALVVGLGVAGMAAAIRLRQLGWSVTMIEKAPERRLGGYFVGLFGTGAAAARRLGVLSSVHTRTPTNSVAWEVRRDGTRVRAAGFLDQPGQPAGVLRGDVEAGLFENLGDTVVRYATKPEQVTETDDGVLVKTRNFVTEEEREERFDLLVGADGVRSGVRRLVFGPDSAHLKSLDAVICAFQLQSQVPGFELKDSLTLAETKRSLWVFPFSDRAPTALFSFRTADVDAQFRADPKEVLKRVYGTEPLGPVLQHAFDELEKTESFLYDSVHQVKMPRWHQGHTVLVGDAAWCLTLYSGMGASMGLAGGSLLGDALEREPGDLERALSAWERQMRPFVKQHQRSALFIGQVFTPSNALFRFGRDWIMRNAGHKLATGKPLFSPKQTANHYMNADITMPALAP